MRWRSYTAEKDDNKGKYLVINDRSFNGDTSEYRQAGNDDTIVINNGPDPLLMIDARITVDNNGEPAAVIAPGGQHQRHLQRAYIQLFGCCRLSKAKCSILAGFLITLCLIHLQTMSNTGSYLISYMIKNSPGGHLMDESNILWIGSICSLTSGLSSGLGGYIELRCGSARYATMIGSACYCIGLISTRWTINYGYYYVLLTYGIMPGLGCGIAWTPTIVNSFGWYPKNKGLAGGIIMAGYGVGAFFFNFIITLIVNPNNLPATKTIFVQDEILDRVPNLFLKLGFTYFIIQTIGCSLLFRPPANEQQQKKLSQRLILAGGKTPHNHCDSNHQNIDDDLHRPLINTRELSTNSIEHNATGPWSMVLSKEFAVLFITIALSSQASVFLSSMQKQYGQTFIKDDHFLSQIGSLSSLSVSVGKLFWGYASDKLSYLHCFTLISVIMFTTVLMLPFDFVLASRYTYVICILMAFSSMNGYSVILNVECFKIFGQRHAAFITGLVWVSATFNIPSSFLIGYLYSNSGRYLPCFLLCSFTLISETILILYTCYHKKRN